MFSLIITIISIALVAALAIASVYYGGSAFSQGTAKANASTVVNQAQQISAANVLYANDNGGANAGSVADLVSGNYLQSAPAMPATIGSSLAIAAGSVSGDITNVEVCQAINNSIGQAEADAMDSTVDATVDVSVVDQQYGCAWEDTDTSGGLNTGDAMAFAYK